MKTFACAAALLCLSAQAQEPDKQILFEAPKGTSDADRLKAAKALAARCVAHGLADATGDTISRAPNTPRQVRLRSAKGFDKESLAAIDFLAAFPCKSVVLRLERFLTEAEKGEYLEGEKAPKGCSWVKHRFWAIAKDAFPPYKSSEAEESSLFLNKPVIDASGKWKIHRHPGGELFGEERPAGVYMTFKGSLVKTMYGAIVPNAEKPGKTMLPLNLFIDGVRFPTDDGIMGWRILETKGDLPDFATWTFPDLTPKSALAWLMENPLPFELKRVEE
ncbi:MAG TPA: hypothetical protein VFS19_04635 [Planctomycetota bacterium]|nr:hypothetical protein [Planctomycetota bacterium]